MMSCASILRCPDCKSSSLSTLTGNRLRCSQCDETFPVIDGRPVLLSHDNQVFPIDAYSKRKESAKTPTVAHLWPSASVNICRKKILKDLREKLASRGNGSVVLVVGGGQQKAQLDQLLFSQDSDLTAIYCDVDSSAEVEVFCDAHNLPFVDGHFDAVITTAVIEHVLYPEQVASEIARVLKLGGYLYSELPFMQQVHEGAYDFTRYTLSGHRRLFNTFHELDTGLVAGPATAFVWSVENLVLAFVRGKRARTASKAIIRLLIGWIKFLDYAIKDRPEAMDGAACTFFLGAKIDDRIPDIKIIESYVGAKVIHHV